jgi:uncharacterized membrane protein (UPF0127 family)
MNRSMSFLSAARRAVPGVCALLLAGALAAQDAAQRLPTVNLSASLHNIRAEVARTPEQRAKGLMHRTALGANDGMLFVFEQPAVQCFWMKNTLLPLSIAYLDDHGRIVNIAEMEPRTLDSHCSTRPVRLALEMNAGWFHKRGLEAGSRLGGPVFER